MSDKKYSKAELAEMAEILRKAGSRGDDPDTILAHITPKEAELLRKNGGAGTPDPHTGLPQFGPEDEGTEAEGGTGGRPDGGKADRDAERADREAVASEARRDKVKEAYGTGDPNEIANRTAEQIGGLGNYGTGKGQADLSKEVQPGEQYGGMRQKASSGWGAGIATGAVTLGLTGNPTLAAAAGKKAKAMAANDGTGWNLDTGSTNGPKPQGSVPDGNREGNYFLPSKASPEPKAPVAAEPVDASTAEVNVFTGQPRKRKNYMSTITGATVPAGTPQGKRLLGS